MRIRRANRLRQHVVNSRNLHHGAHRTSGNDARAFRSGLEQNLPRAVRAEHLMRNRGALKVQLHHVFLGLFDGLANGHGNFARLAHAESGVAALIADHHQRGEAQIFAALDDFGDAMDGDDLIFQIFALISMGRRTDSVSLKICFDILV